MTPRPCLALCAALAAGACATGGESAAPAPRVKEEPHFFVRAFAGFFPIPNRYEVVNYANGRLRLVSPTTLAVMSAARPNEIGAVSSISLRNRPCPDHSADRLYQTVESGKRFGLSYALYNVIGADLETISERVEIGDGYQCLVIVGESRGFWRESLKKYGRVTELMANP